MKNKKISGKPLCLSLVLQICLQLPLTPTHILNFYVNFLSFFLKNKYSKSKTFLSKKQSEDKNKKISTF